MKVFRLCNKNEIELILNQKNFSNAGCECEICPSKNTHKYIPKKKYLHFFEQEISLLYLFLKKSTFVCVYDIPENILNQTKGIGYYLNFINFTNLDEVTEYAIESEQVEFKYLKQVYAVKFDLDFDYIPSREEFFKNFIALCGNP